MEDNPLKELLVMLIRNRGDINLENNVKLISNSVLQFNELVAGTQRDKMITTDDIVGSG